MNKTQDLKFIYNTVKLNSAFLKLPNYRNIGHIASWWEMRNGEEGSGSWVLRATLGPHCDSFGGGDTEIHTQENHIKSRYTHGNQGMQTSEIQVKVTEDIDFHMRGDVAVWLCVILIGGETGSGVNGICQCLCNEKSKPMSVETTPEDS